MNHPNLVVISGCSGGGKSTLLEALAQRGHTVFPEPGRQIVREQLSVDGDGLPWDNGIKFAELCVSRAIYFYGLAQAANRLCFFDRSFIDNIAGVQRSGLPMPDYFARVPQVYRYSKCVFMTPPWPALFAQDGERRHSFAAAVEEYEDLLQAYPAHGYDVVGLPQVSVAERVAFIERQLRP